MWRRKCVRHHRLKPATAAVTPRLSPNFLQNHELGPVWRSRSGARLRQVQTPGRGAAQTPRQGGAPLRGSGPWAAGRRAGLGPGPPTSRGWSHSPCDCLSCDCPPAAGPRERGRGFPEDSAHRLHAAFPWPVRDLQAAQPPTQSGRVLSPSFPKAPQACVASREREPQTR